MSIPRPQTLQAKFLLGLVAIMLALGLFFSAGLYFHLSSLLKSEVSDKARLVLAQVDAVQRYVRETLRPRMYGALPKGEFMIESMSTSYISRMTMDQLNLSRSEYHYRRVAENARNPQFEVNGFERELLDRFRRNPDTDLWEGYRNLDGLEFFIMARPVRFDPSCMNCHGAPSDAPQELITRYGAKRGFGHKVGELAGLDVVGLPVDASVAQIREATVGYIGVYAAGMLVFFALIQIFFNHLVVQNMRRLSQFFRARLHDQADIKALEKLDQGDELEEMVRGMEDIGDYLLDAKAQIQDYASNLEMMVDERTAELSHEASERQADVRLFVRLLDGLNKSQTRKELWEKALPRIAERFGASEIGFVCLMASQRFHAWPDAGKRPPLPEDWREIVTSAVPRFEPGRAYIPVGASDAAVEGLLCIAWREGGPATSQDREVLRALGQQLGIAMENLAALDNLLRQKDLLQSVVEGIGDPLLYMDDSCNVFLANQAARELAATLSSSASPQTGRTNAGALLPLLLSGGQSAASCPLPGLREALTEDEPFVREVGLSSGRSFSISMYPVQKAEGATGQGGRIVVYVREITKERRMLARMQQSEKLATVGKLAAGLAHEMNNPLGVIKCYAELIKASLTGPQEREDLEVIVRHATQAQNVLQDLLNFARPKRASIAPLNLWDVVEASAKVFQVQAENRGLAISVENGEDLPPIAANLQSLEQILTNLLNNAMDALENLDGQGRVTIRTAFDPKREEIMLQVADNGPGILPEQLGRIFDPFFTTKEVGKGTGLGLAVVYGLVQEAGGRIEVTGHDGAVFTMHFPVAGNGEAPGGGIELMDSGQEEAR